MDTNQLYMSLLLQRKHNTSQFS